MLLNKKSETFFFLKSKKCFRNKMFRVHANGETLRGTCSCKNVSVNDSSFAGALRTFARESSTTQIFFHAVAKVG